MSQNDTPARTPPTTSTDLSGPPVLMSETSYKTRQEASQGANMGRQEDTIVPPDSVPLEGQEQVEPPGASDSLAIQIGSTTLARLPASKRPNPSTVCEGCPAAMWYARGEKVLNYCRIMHLISWETGEKDPVTSCDGPAIASQ